MCYNFNEFELKNPDVKKKTPKQLNQRKKETPPKEKQQKNPPYNNKHIHPQKNPKTKQLKKAQNILSHIKRNLTKATSKVTPLLG